MNKEQRQNHILQLIQQSDGNLLGTRELAEQFGVSEMTVRRDLQELSQEGLLRRQHGGAAPSQLRRPVERGEIGIILVSSTGKFTDPFFNAILEGADRRLQELGYRIAYINTRAEVQTAAQVRELLKSHPVDGIILIGFVGNEGIEYLKANVRALVQTTESIGPDLDTITFDGFYGMQQMVDHLVDNGYRRLGFITGGFDLRHKGFMDRVRAHGLPDDPELSVVVPKFSLDGWTPDIGYAGAEQLMSLANPPDAIVCASDRIAIGAIQWLHQHNYHVPEDIAVTGFDNIAESAFTAPSLTTVHVHKQLMGELAAERAVKRINNPDEIPLFIQTPTHLVIRQSCGSQENKAEQKHD
ncbi:MAG TPA: substrate-binding domain-containing protein [Oceanobacillus sp.]|nr:substrate-binding domain-containing protein [Oceanobacillus sp.]